MAIAQLMYISDAAQAFERSELDNLHEQCVVNNNARGLTGVLICGAGHFIQALEGDVGEITRCFGRFCNDQRHQNVRLLGFQLIDRPIFDQWSMGLLNLDDNSSFDSSELFRLAREMQSTADPNLRQQRFVHMLTEFRRQLADAGDRRQAA